jgi:predicted membrane chloride channel (bestrophin family)
MNEVDILYEASRLFGALTVLFSAHFGWRGSKVSKFFMIMCFIIAITLGLLELFSPEITVMSSLSDNVIDAVMWSILAVTLWFSVNLAYSRNWGEHKI